MKISENSLEKNQRTVLIEPNESEREDIGEI